MRNIIVRDNMIIFTSVPFSPTLKTISHNNKRWFYCGDVLRILRRNTLSTWERKNVGENIRTLDYVNSAGRTASGKFIDTFGLNKILERANDSYVNQWFTETVFPTLSAFPSLTVTPSSAPVNPFAEKKEIIESKSPVYRFIQHKHDDLGTIRSTRIDDCVWLSVNDVCRVLKVRNFKMETFKVPRENRKAINLGKTASNTYMITASAAMMLASSYTHSDRAPAFVNWLVHTIVPAVMAEPEDSFLIPEKVTKKKTTEEKIADAMAKAKIADMISDAENSILIGELAKMLKQNGCDIGQKRLFSMLRDDGFLCKDKAHWNQPTQNAMEKKLLAISAKPYLNWKGGVVVNRCTRVTGKGVVYFLDKYSGHHTTTTISIKEAA